jgi:hypothetical protein
MASFCTVCVDRVFLSASETVFQSIFDTTIEQGGPIFTGERTVHQIMAVPAERTMWFKVNDYSGWEQIMFGPFFD